MKLLLALFLSLPLFAQLPPGVTRIEVDTRRGRFIPELLTASPDGSVWAFAPGDGVARIAPDGTVTHLQMPRIWHTSMAGPGPDGAMWAGSTGWIGRIDPVTLTVDRWALGIEPRVRRVFSGTDGNLWLVLRTPSLQGRIWRMRPDGLLLDTYEAGRGRMDDAVLGSDGALYAAVNDDKLVRLTTDGERTEFPARRLYNLAAGPGILWSWVRSIEAPEAWTRFFEILKDEPAR